MYDEKPSNLLLSHSTHIRPKKIFSGLIQPISHVLMIRKKPAQRALAFQIVNRKS